MFTLLLQNYNLFFGGDKPEAYNALLYISSSGSSDTVGTIGCQSFKSIR